MNVGTIALSAVIFVATCCPLLVAQEKKSTPTKESCLNFVQEFYGWYVPKARDINVNSLDLALKERRSAFSAELIKGVESVEADARSHQEAGLDFDWVLNSQDPGDAGDPGYVVSNSKLSGYICRVDVLRQRPDGKGESISPALKFENGRWRFTNFHYPDSPYPQSENLLSMISGYLRTAREPN
jgi:hypothetical protein